MIAILLKLLMAQTISAHAPHAKAAVMSGLASAQLSPGLLIDYDCLAWDLAV